MNKLSKNQFNEHISHLGVIHSGRWPQTNWKKHYVVRDSAAKVLIKI